MQNFWAESYERHIEHDKTDKTDKKVETWKQFDTADAWRHQRMYDSLLPIIKEYPQSTWLTIGDGRFGTDSNYLIRNGIKNVLTTSISDSLIKQAKEEGFIQDYKIENAERLSFEDNSFDFVLCKEAYHHFPRPMVALYEMIRVAKKGVLLIEPNDKNIDIISASKTLLRPINRVQLIKNFIKDFLRMPRYKYHEFNEPTYEEVGNYIFSISEREIEKVALGLNLPAIAFRGLNDCYFEGIEFEKATEESALFSKLKNEIERQDQGCKSGISKYNLLVALILKTNIESSFVNELQQKQYNVISLQRNPYIKS